MRRPVRKACGLHPIAPTNYPLVKRRSGHAEQLGGRGLIVSRAAQGLGNQGIRRLVEMGKPFAGLEVY